MEQRRRKKKEKDEEHGVVIFHGRFSWWAAWSMMVWVLGFLACTVMMVLSARGSAFKMVSEEVSYIRGTFKHNGGNVIREINQPFTYEIPQTALFFALAAAFLGLFTVSYFMSFVLLEDQGAKRVVDIGLIIEKGVKVYLDHTTPVVVGFVALGGMYVGVTAGFGALACFAAGAVLNLASARLGVSMTMQGQKRLAHALTHELFDAVQIGVRTGSIGGLIATSLGLGGIAAMWLLIRDTLALSGFGSGASIVSFYLRIGGGIFAKGADIGADLVGEFDERKTEQSTSTDKHAFDMQMKMSKLEDLWKTHAAKQSGESSGGGGKKPRRMEEDMHELAAELHPIDYLDAVGENVNDVTGTCADLFESMVLILSTSAIIGARATPNPSFYSGLPFWIVSTGQVGCSLVAYYCHVHEHFSAKRIRWSLRFNLLVVIILVQSVQLTVSFQAYLAGTLEFETFRNFTVIALMGQLAPEICIVMGEYFTSVDYRPVQSLALNADLGIVQVVLQGFGQGFFSTGLPATCMIIAVVLAWRLEGHFGLALLSAASVSGTGFQGGIASYGAIAANAHKIVHLTTYHAMTRHRANVCAALGDATAHAGNTISAVNAFSAVFNVALTLLAQSYTVLGQDYMQVTGSILSNSSQAGLVTGVVMTFLFVSNTMVSSLDTSRAFAKICKDSTEVGRIDKLPFPQSHIRPLKRLAAHGTVITMRQVFSPMVNTLACPMVGGFFLGTKGLLFLISGSNVLVLCLSIFLINSGQSWVAARKFVLFGLLKNAEGEVIGPDSVHYANLSVGESIGGPFEDTTGPSLNNFIKFVAVFAFVTGGPGKLYDETPDKTWPLGFVVAIGSAALVSCSKFGLRMFLSYVSKVVSSQIRRAESFEEDDDEDKEEDFGDFDL